MSQSNWTHTLPIVGSLAAVLAGGVVSYAIVGAQARTQARAEQTTAAYAAYVEAASEFVQALEEMSSLPQEIPPSSSRSIRERLAAARGRIAIYGTPDVIAALPVGSLNHPSVRDELLMAIAAMRADVGEERVASCELSKLVYGESCSF